jgi:6-phosphogluconolactonase/glucosamine-6-phosphate isomerase/deaminase
MRITLTGKIIRQARQRIFLITGKSKSNVLNEILKNEVPAQKYPAFHILSLPDTAVYLDREAASFLG